MKYLLSILCLLIITTSQAQNYIKTLENNKTWKLTDDIGMGVQVYPKYHLSCDTIMNGYQYYKLWNRDPSDQCKGYLREDTITQRVHFMTADFSLEMLVADYLLTPGDTFEFTYAYNNQYNTIVDTVSHLDTILINQVPHKRIHFLHLGSAINGPNLVFTEGQGDNFSGVAHNHPVITDQVLLDDVYSDSTITCGLLSSIDDWGHYYNNLNIYPNPAKDVLHIDIHTERPKNAYFLKITNVSGQVLLSKEINSNLEQIHIEALHKGVYFIHIFDENKMISIQKFVKN